MMAIVGLTTLSELLRLRRLFQVLRGYQILGLLLREGGGVLGLWELLRYLRKPRLLVGKLQLLWILRLLGVLRLLRILRLLGILGLLGLLRRGKEVVGDDGVSRDLGTRWQGEVQRTSERRGCLGEGGHGLELFEKRTNWMSEYD